ncbi:MAG: terminase large subunit, partial [Selenomonadaceae bacterium]|nr:terminase large subunit [Selenomonadaceae bacterium]
MNWLMEYHTLIASGAVIVSKRIKKQYDKLADDITHPKGGYIFSERHANKPIDFIERFCKHSKGEWAGKSIKLELWQKAYISALFGFVDSSGNRKYRESLLYVARKNGKSTMLAGLALYCLIADGEGGAEVYCAAT